MRSVSKRWLLSTNPKEMGSLYLLVAALRLPPRSSILFWRRYPRCSASTYFILSWVRMERRVSGLSTRYSALCLSNVFDSFLEWVATELPPSLPPVGMFTPRWLGHQRAEDGIVNLLALSAFSCLPCIWSVQRISLSPPSARSCPAARGLGCTASFIAGTSWWWIGVAAGISVRGARSASSIGAARKPASLRPSQNRCPAHPHRYHLLGRCSHLRLAGAYSEDQFRIINPGLAVHVWPITLHRGLIA